MVISVRRVNGREPAWWEAVDTARPSARRRDAGLEDPDGPAQHPGRREPGRRPALERHSPRLETVRLILRQQEAGPPPVCPPVASVRPELARIAVPVPTLSAYDALVEGSR